jgi:hypothetical protein
MILVILLGKKNTWTSQIIFFKLLAGQAALVAQAVSHSSSCGFLLWIGPNSFLAIKSVLQPLFLF